MKAIKVIFISIGALLAALVVIPLTILAGLFVWLKLTEEAEEDDLEIEDTV
jgi:membrane protein YdbS with pleckstrin-like domain